MMRARHFLAIWGTVGLSLCWPLYGCKNEKASVAGAGDEGATLSTGACPRPAAPSSSVEDTAVNDCETAVCKRTRGKVTFQPRTRGPRPMTRMDIENRFWGKDPNIKAFTVTGMIMVAGYYTGKQGSRVYFCEWKDGEVKGVDFQCPR